MLTINAAGKRVKLFANGEYRIFTNDLSSFSSISAMWAAPGVAPAGSLSFSVDGDPGQSPELGSISLGQAGQPGSRTCAANMELAFVDVALSGLPANGQLMLYLR